MSVANEPNYQLQDGTPTTLETLCRKDPEWAASRIRVERADVARLREALTKCCEAVEDVGPWVEDESEKLARVCEHCGGSADAILPAVECHNNGDCPFGDARRLLVELERKEGLK